MQKQATESMKQKVGLFAIYGTGNIWKPMAEKEEAIKNTQHLHQKLVMLAECCSYMTIVYVIEIGLDTIGLRFQTGTLLDVKRHVGHGMLRRSEASLIRAKTTVLEADFDRRAERRQLCDVLPALCQAGEDRER